LVPTPGSFFFPRCAGIRGGAAFAAAHTVMKRLPAGRAALTSLNGNVQ
jgi:hypothetical protein